MNKLQQDINDLAAGRHRQWHVEAARTKWYGELGWEYDNESGWEFILGFDCQQDARAAMERIEDALREGEPYGATQYDLRLSEEVGGHRRWRD